MSSSRQKRQLHHHQGSSFSPQSTTSGASASTGGGCYSSLSPGTSAMIKVNDTSFTTTRGQGVGAAAVGQERRSNQHHCEYYSPSTSTVVNAAGSLQNTSPRSFSYTTSTVHTGMTHSITKSDASYLDLETEILKSIKEEDHNLDAAGGGDMGGEDVVMDDASARSFDIPDPDQWELRGFEDDDEEEDADSICSVVAQDGEDNYDWEPLNLSCFAQEQDKDNSGNSKKKKKKQQQQEQEPSTQELKDMPLATNTSFVGWGHQTDGSSHNGQMLSHPRQGPVDTSEVMIHNNAPMEQQTHDVDSHQNNTAAAATAAGMTPSYFAPTFPNNHEHYPAANATWSSSSTSMTMMQNTNGPSSSMQGFYPGMGYSEVMQNPGQYHDGRSTYSSCASYPHQDSYSGTTNNDQHAHSAMNDTTRSSASGGMTFQNGWTEKPFTSVQSETHEMLQARLGLSSFRPVDTFGSNYEQFSRANSVHAYTYSAENIERKQRYGTASVVSAPADTSSHLRTVGNVQHMGNHPAYQGGYNNASMHPGGYGRGNHSAYTTMSAHSLDYPGGTSTIAPFERRTSIRSSNGPSSLHEYPTYNNHSVDNGGHGMYSSHNPSEASGSMYSTASGHYPPSAPSSSYYQEQHPLPPSSSGDNHGLFPMTTHPSILHDGAIVGEMDKSLATKFSYAVLYEVESCSFENRDRTGKRRGLELGFRGLACRHCKGFTKKIGGRLFPSTIKTMSDTQKTLIPLYNHLIKCPSVPNETKEHLRSLKDLHESERKGKSYGSQKALFTEVWRRLHGKVPKDGHL